MLYQEKSGNPAAAFFLMKPLGGTPRIFFAKTILPQREINLSVPRRKLGRIPDKQTKFYTMKRNSLVNRDAIF
jgi:hypothetical protein